MNRGKLVSNGAWLAMLLAGILAMPLAPLAARAQPGPGFGRQPLSVPAKPGAAIVRGRYASESLRMIQDVAKAFPASNKLDVTFDYYASFGWFCADEDLFHVLIQEGDLTPYDQTCLQHRFPAGTLRPEAFHVGRLRVIFAVNKSNSIQSLGFGEIRKALHEKGKTLHWQEVGGAGTAAIHCFGPPDQTWARQLVQDKCMSRWHDTDQPGVRELQRLAFRDDLVSCADAKEVLAKVRGDRYALGFFACSGPLMKKDLEGVKLLAIAETADAAAVAAPLDLECDPAYPLAEPLCLYVHPSALPWRGSSASSPRARKRPRSSRSMESGRSIWRKRPAANSAWQTPRPAKERRS